MTAQGGEASKGRRGAPPEEPPPVVSDYALVPIEKLREHEAIDPKNLEAREADIVAHGGVVPIVADMEHHIILNGHHRYNALKRLGCRRAPVYLVDYFSTDVRLELWPESSVCRLSKRDVVKMGLGRGLFPPKTTRHTFRYRFGRKRVPLSELM